MSNIKPCPFCGDTNIYPTADPLNRDLCYIQCVTCGARGSTNGIIDHANFYDDALEMWNTRHEPEDAE